MDDDAGNCEGGCDGALGQKGAEEMIVPAEPCPQCASGELVPRANKKTGQAFYGCSRWPDCRFAVRSLDRLKPKASCAMTHLEIAEELKRIHDYLGKLKGHLVKTYGATSKEYKLAERIYWHGPNKLRLLLESRRLVDVEQESNALAGASKV